MRRVALALLLTGGAFATGETFQGLMDSAMMRMHAGMHAATPSGNPDRDFLTMMIPHHQGAVDAAKAELLYGKDPQVRRLAQEILAEQALEIDYMHRLLDSKTGAPQGQGQP